jgi:hypothetical protein
VEKRGLAGVGYAIGCRLDGKDFKGVSNERIVAGNKQVIN